MAEQQPIHGWQRLVLARRPAPVRYGVAILAGTASLALARALHGIEGSELSGLALASVVFSAIYGGLGPAIVDTAITALGVDYFVSAPVGQVLDSWSSVLRIATYAVVGYAIATIVAWLREAYQRLAKEHRETDLAKRAREDILALVSHDLRSPLSAIQLNVEYLLRLARERRAGDMTAAADGILRSTRQMARLIEDLLDAVRIEKGQFRAEMAEHDLTEIVEDALLDLRSAIRAKGVRLARAAPKGDYRLRCDPVRIRQALDNLLSNAVKFSPEGGPVDLALDASPRWLSVRIRDCGPGIAETDQARIFERYWQGSAEAYRGTGLGLFITKTIAEIHGGRIQVDSRPGQGAEFTLYLPRDPGQPARPRL